MSICLPVINLSYFGMLTPRHIVVCISFRDLSGVSHPENSEQCMRQGMLLSYFYEALLLCTQEVASQEKAIYSNCPLLGVSEVFISVNVYLGFGGKATVKGRWERRISRLWKVKFRKDYNYN